MTQLAPIYQSDAWRDMSVGEFRLFHAVTHLRMTTGEAVVMSGRKLAEETGVSRSKVYTELARLAGRGLVTVDQVARGAYRIDLPGTQEVPDDAGSESHDTPAVPRDTREVPRGTKSESSTDTPEVSSGTQEVPDDTGSESRDTPAVPRDTQEVPRGTKSESSEPEAADGETYTDLPTGDNPPPSPLRGDPPPGGPGQGGGGGGGPSPAGDPGRQEAQSAPASGPRARQKLVARTLDEVVPRLVTGLQTHLAEVRPEMIRRDLERFAACEVWTTWGAPKIASFLVGVYAEEAGKCRDRTATDRAIVKSWPSYFSAVTAGAFEDIQVAIARERERVAQMRAAGPAPEPERKKPSEPTWQSCTEMLAARERGEA